MNPLVLFGGLAVTAFFLTKKASAGAAVATTQGQYTTEWARLPTATQTAVSELMMSDPVAANPSVSASAAWQQRLSQTKAWAQKLRTDGFPAVAHTLELRVSAAHQAATRKG